MGFARVTQESFNPKDGPTDAGKIHRSPALIREAISSPIVSHHD